MNDDEAGKDYLPILASSQDCDSRRLLADDIMELKKHNELVIVIPIDRKYKGNMVKAHSVN